METIKIKLDGGIMPTKGSAYAAAYDLFVPEDVTLVEGRQKIDLRFCVELPTGMAAIIQPRSGFSAHGLECVYKLDRGQGDVFAFDPHFRLDADVLIGLVDEDYRGHVGVTLKVNRKIMDCERFIIERGTRIAQMRIVAVPSTSLVSVEELDMSHDRGGGFGHTGTK